MPSPIPTPQADIVIMPPKKHRASPPPTPPPAQRTRGALQVAPWQLFFELIDRIDALGSDEKTDLKAKLQDKNLTDMFLPHMTASKFQKRLTMTAECAQAFVAAISVMKREGKIAKKAPRPEKEDYDAVVSAIRASLSAFGSQQQAIDNHCDISTVTVMLVIIYCERKRTHAFTRATPAAAQHC